MWRTVLLALAGCYGPRIPTGAPCTTSSECPRELVCAAASGTCERADVDAATSDAPAVTGCWAAWLAGTQELADPLRIAQLSAGEAESNVSLADGDLTVFFSRPMVLGGNDIFHATRSSTAAAFSAPAVIGELATAQIDGRLTLSADGSLGVLASERLGGAGGSDLWSTSRDALGTFTEPTQKIVEGLNTSVNQFDPELSPDGLSLYYSQTTLAGQALMVARRATASVAFGAGEAIAIEGAGLVHADPTVSPDGRVIVFSSGATSNTLDLYVATRAAPTAPFGKATRLAISSQQVDADPELAQDGCALLFSSNRAGSASRDLWMSAVRAD